MPYVRSKLEDPTREEYWVYVLRLPGRDPKYVGVTRVGLHSRLKGHRDSAKRGTKNKLYDWARSVGFENLIIEPIVKCENEDQMYEEEVFWIATIKKMGIDLCNLSAGGKGNSTPCTEERKVKISKSTRGTKKSLETRTLMSKSRLAIKDLWYKETLSEEHRNKISAANSGERNPFYGRKHSKESITKMIHNNHHVYGRGASTMLECVHCKQESTE